MILYLVGEFIHILAVTIWLGGALMLVTVGHVARLTRAGDLLDRVVHVQAFVIPRIFVPMVLLATVSGLYMVWVKHLPVQAWLAWGFAGIVVSGVIGIATLAPLAETAADLLDSEFTRAEGMAAARRLLCYATADMSVLISIVFAMVVEPRWSDVSTLLGMALFVVAVTGWALTRKPVVGLN